ncbi:hypothetical protein BKA64DRAFT_433898 [Cadophora sp. MPI-SDFR-AT-0126]|nr:hypothetical protein BKA64DRAFT_433898 [Leotiomycetes sp. MPI-SDFR-AT-0126]
MKLAIVLKGSLSSMATYGKKKHSILPSFSVLKDSDNESKPKKDKSKRRGSMAFSMPTFHDNNYKKESPSNHHDDSIEEMASILLDDTTMDQLRPEGGKRMSQSAASKALPGLRTESQDGKSLPQLPKLIFNGDDAWALRTAPVVTAAGTSNQIEFSESSPQPSTFLHRISAHARKSSIPEIPRRSSKRRSGRPKSTVVPPRPEAGDRRSVAHNSRQTLKNSISPPRPSDSSQPKQSGFVAADVNNKIEAMISATKALKPGSEGAVLLGPLVPTKKRRLVDNKVLTKMKSALNDRFNGRTAKKRDSMLNDKLLDASLNEVQDFEEELSISAIALTTMELRMNEGDNFKNPKIYTLTGHGNVRRKPLADDGKSLRSRKSADHTDDPFSERPHSSSITRTPTSFENRLRDDMSYDQGSDFIPNLPSRCHTPKYTREKKARTSIYDEDFDAMLSSSPVAQSTPRIRLEPTFEEDGKKLLKNVPADTRSLFDSDQMDIDSDTMGQSSPSQELIKRKNSLLKDYGVRYQSSKKVKKHPSPSKAELEGLERALQNFLPLSPSEGFPPIDDANPVGESLVPAAALAPQDPNRKIQDTKRRGTKLEPLKTTESMPILLNQSKVSQPASPRENISRVDGGNRYMSHKSLADRMDLDELQWDDTAYNIGMKRL